MSGVAKRLILILAVLIAAVPSFSWNKTACPIKTPWWDDVTADKTPWPEHPKPQFKRKNWHNLNGIWQFQEGKSTKIPGGKLESEIMVPFPWQSALSGIRKNIHDGWYKKIFKVPNNLKGGKLLLHFMGVDWEAQVYLNGKKIGTHTGGYDPFSYDISGSINWDGDNELAVKVWDPGNGKIIPRGKQNDSKFSQPKGFAYCPCSGIWQTVYLEKVSSTYIKDFHIIPNIDKGVLAIDTEIGGSSDGVTLKAIAFENNGEVHSQADNLKVGSKVELPLKKSSMKLWNFHNPYLYGLLLVLEKGGKQIDVVESYFGMNKIEKKLEPEGKFYRPYLNNRDDWVFQVGPLDQGFWPDGIYTPATDEGMRFDVEEIKKWGFNSIRKHVKVEVNRFYYWCDRMGMIVQQDMPNAGYNRDAIGKDSWAKKNHQDEWTRIIKTHWNHPSILIWVVFNEGWGEFDTKRMTEYTENLDPARLVTGNSGWHCSYFVNTGDFRDEHHYLFPKDNLFKVAWKPLEEKRIFILGEYGALGYRIENHLWAPGLPMTHDHYTVKKGDLKANKKKTTDNYVTCVNKMLNKINSQGLCAGIYTQTSDTEQEINGVFTYDRKIEKFDNRMVEFNEKLWKKGEYKERKVYDHPKIITSVISGNTLSNKNKVATKAIQKTTVYNMQGKKVVESKSAATVKTKSLPKGIYVVKNKKGTVEKQNLKTVVK